MMRERGRDISLREIERGTKGERERNENGARERMV